MKWQDWHRLQNKQITASGPNNSFLRVKAKMHREGPIKSKLQHYFDAVRLELIDVNNDHS